MRHCEILILMRWPVGKSLVGKIGQPQNDAFCQTSCNGTVIRNSAPACELPTSSVTPI